MGNVVAEPMSREGIRQITTQIREKLNLSSIFYFPIIHFIEKAMPFLYEGFAYDYVDVSEMPGRYAEALPQENLMRIREDVYYNALKNIGRDRFTLAHEVGHFILHGEGRVSLARTDSVIPPFRDPEWQANTFAGELLAPVALISGKGIEFVTNACKVSMQTAHIQTQQCNKTR